MPSVIPLYRLIATEVGRSIRPPVWVGLMMLEILHWRLWQILSVCIIHKLGQYVKALGFVVFIPIFIADIFVVWVDGVLPEPAVAFFDLIS